MILKETHFSMDYTQERVVIWLQYINAKVGDSVEIHEYALWIEEQCINFKKKLGYNTDTPLTKIPFGQRKFSMYLQNLVIKEKILAK